MPAAAAAVSTNPRPAKDVQLASAAKDATQAADSSMLGVTVQKKDDFSNWYVQTIVKAELVEYYDVSGCYILRPASYRIWEALQQFLDSQFKANGVENCYFPSFVTKKRLETESSHVEGFSPEVAWVTKYGETDLAEPIAIRPTSETIMYPSFAKWIRSYRDLPLLLNQWCPVVRWEFKQPTPFIRTREFLWQEGHTAHASAEDARSFALKMLDVYKRAYEEYLAVPVVAGRKSTHEKFAGGDTTFSVEAFVPENGRAIQGATSHYLGQNFSKMFGVEFENNKKEKEHAFQTSWGFSTRTIGAMIMVHGDDKGLVLPPKLAALQAVIVPIVFKEGDESAAVQETCHALKAKFVAAGIRTHVDDRSNFKPGFKYNHWELRGVCVRVEIGPRDMKNGTVMFVRRDDGSKKSVAQVDAVTELINTLDEMQKQMLAKATAIRDASIVKVMEWKDVMPALNTKKLILAPWCDTEASEEEIKKETSKLSGQVSGEASEDVTSSLTGAMKTICIPFEQPPLPEGTKCFYTGQEAKCWALWGRSY